MSGAQTSTFTDPNILYKTLSGAGMQEVEQNRLMNVEKQQTIAGNNTEVVARAASTLLDPTLYPTEEARAAAWPGIIQQLRSNGYAPNAPAEYPGVDHLKAAARMGTPSADLYKLQLGQSAAQGAITSLSPSASAAPAPAPSGGAVSTAPATSGTIEPDALTRAQAVRDGLIKRGLDVDTATAFAANALHESGANPNTRPGDAGASHGTFQWRDDRYNRFNSITGRPLDNAPLDQQLDYVIHELNTTEGAARDRIAAAQGPAAKAAAVSQFYLRPKDVQPEMARRSATAAQLASQWGGAGTSTAAPVIAGDSLASSGGLGGSGVVGASPKTVLAAVQADSRAGKYNGQPVVLSTGASNDPTDLASVEQQIREAQGGNAGKIAVLGVGPAVEAKAPGTNAKLQALAKSYGADFVPLPADQMSPDGVHPTAQGYATLKAAVAPAQGAPGGGGQPGRYQVASNAPVSPPTSTAPASGQPAAAAQPAPSTVAQVTPNASPPAAPQMVTPSGQALPAPPQAPALLSNGLTEQQWGLIQSQLRLAAPGGPAAVAQVLAKVPELANSNRAALQQAWADAHPDLQFKETAQGFIVVHPKTGAPVGFIPAEPNMQSRGQPGTGVWDGSKWVIGGPTDTPGTWLYAGSNPVQFLPASSRPAAANFDLQKDLHRRDTDALPQYNEQNQQAASNQIRIQQMRELVDQISSGAGGAERANWANIADTMGWHDLAKRLVGMGGAAAAQEFAKYGLATAGAQERGDLGARGSIGAINLYKSANPGLELQPDANKKMLTAQLIAAQANRDYTQGAMDYVNRNGDQFLRGGNYTPLSHFDADWAAARNPQLYAAAMSAINGDPWQKWTKALNMKSADDVQRVVDIVRRADPTSSVMWKNGEPHDVGTPQ